MEKKFSNFSIEQYNRLIANHPIVIDYITMAPFKDLVRLNNYVKHLERLIYMEFPDLLDDFYVLAWIITVMKQTGNDFKGLKQTARTNYKIDYSGSDELFKLLTDWNEYNIDIRSIKFNIVKNTRNTVSDSNASAVSSDLEIVKIEGSKVIEFIMSKLLGDNNNNIDLLRVFSSFWNTPPFNTSEFYGSDLTTDTRIAANLVGELVTFFGYKDTKVPSHIKNDIINLLISFGFIEDLVKGSKVGRKNLSKPAKFDELLLNYKKNHVTNS
jgi:hypothetical protein